jgi:hypothetical protein
VLLEGRGKGGEDEVYPWKPLARSFTTWREKRVKSGNK